jgi:hypothetical protein
VKDVPLSLFYEDLIQDLNGKELVKLTREKFLKHYKLIEYGKILREEVKKLGETSSRKKIYFLFSGFSTNKIRFRLKIEQIKDPFMDTPSDDLEFFMYSLSDESEILETYLNVDPCELIHKGCEIFDKSMENIEIRLISTEFTYNNESLGLIESLKGLIDNLPNFDWDKNFAKFKCALLIGPWYLEFTDTSMCIPKRLHPAISEIFHKIEPIRVLKGKSISQVAKKIANVVTEWNTKYFYTAVSPDIRNKEGNGYYFINDLIHSFDEQEEFKFEGALIAFMNEIKQFDDSGPSIFPDKQYNENPQRFSRINIIENHNLLDNELLDIMENDPQFKRKNPHDFVLFQLIDLGFWIRSMISPKEEYIQCYDDEFPICPCFQRESFERMFHELSIPFEEFEKKTQQHRKKVEKTISFQKQTKFGTIMMNVARTLEMTNYAPTNENSGNGDEKNTDDDYYSSDDESSEKKKNYKDIYGDSKFKSKRIIIDPKRKSNLMKVGSGAEFTNLSTQSMSSGKSDSSFDDMLTASFTKYSKNSLHKTTDDEHKRWSTRKRLSKKVHSLQFSKNHNELSKSNPDINKKLEIFQNEKEKEIFMKFTIENSHLEEFQFYEMYHTLLNEVDHLKRIGLMQTIYERFIDERGPDSIQFTFRKLKILKKIFHEDPLKSIQLVYSHV